MRVVTFFTHGRIATLPLPGFGNPVMHFKGSHDLGEDAEREDLYRIAFCLTGDEQGAVALVCAAYARQRSRERRGIRGKPRLLRIASLYKNYIAGESHPPSPTGLAAAPAPGGDEIETAARKIDAMEVGALAKAFQKVPEPYRAPLAIFYAADLSLPEIAHVLGKPGEIVLAQLGQGRRRLCLALCGDSSGQGVATLERKPV